VKKLSRTSILAAAAVLALAAQAPAQTPPKVDLKRDVGLDQNLNVQVPTDLAFRDEEGRSVRIGDLLTDKPTVLNLLFYKCPNICMMELEGMVNVFRGSKFKVGRDFNVITVSIAPKETPRLASAKKEEYLQLLGQPGAAEGWHFLTGDEEPIRRLAKVVGFRYVYVPETDSYAHPAGLMILTPTGRTSRYLYGIVYRKRDLEMSLVEAGQGRIGTLVDKVIIPCFYAFDPKLRRYSFYVHNGLRVAGLLTVIALGMSIFTMSRRYRSRPLPATEADDREGARGAPGSGA